VTLHSASSTFGGWQSVLPVALVGAAAAAIAAAVGPLLGGFITTYVPFGGK
jgi:Ca2+/H+ antiporter